MLIATRPRPSLTSLRAPRLIYRRSKYGSKSALDLSKRVRHHMSSREHRWLGAHKPTSIKIKAGGARTYQLQPAVDSRLPRIMKLKRYWIFHQQRFYQYSTLALTLRCSRRSSKIRHE